MCFILSKIELYFYQTRLVFFICLSILSLNSFKNSNRYKGAKIILNFKWYAEMESRGVLWEQRKVKKSGACLACSDKKRPLLHTVMYAESQCCGKES